MSTFRNTSKSTKFFIITMGVCIALLPFGVEAQSKKPTKPAPEAKTNNSDKVDISDIQDKYWAPKDTDFSVVQNRTYTKEKRFSLSVLGGRMVNDSYSEGYIYGVTGNYYFSERYGVELSYMSFDLEDNQILSDQSTFGGGVRPNHGRVESMIDVGFNYVPFYAKVSVLGSKIIYFDMMFTPVIGMVDYNQRLESGDRSESTYSYGFDVSQHFFISKRVTLRADLKNRWFNEKRREWLTSAGNDSLGEVFNNTTVFTLGVQFFF